MNAEKHLESILAEIMRLRTENDSLREELRRDHLTGIFNERALLEHVEDSPYPGWFIFIDGDHFGKLNKELGHEAVNMYIVEFAEWLRGQVRGMKRMGDVADAIAIRKHGDEFLAWVSNKKGARRIRDLCRTWRSGDGRVTVSAGIGRDVNSASRRCTLHKESKRENSR